MKLGTINEVAFSMSKMLMVVVVMMAMFVADGADTNEVYSPCSDARVQKGDGFSFGIAISEDKDSFFLNQGGPQLSPCDHRLGLAGKGAQLAVFRPKVNELSLLTINKTSFDSVCTHIFWYMNKRDFNSKLLLRSPYH